MMPDLATWLARKPKGRAPKKPLPKHSKKGIVGARQYSAAAKRYKKANPLCQACKLKPTVDVHHKHGRGRYLLDQSTWMPVCRPCHLWIHNNPKEARKLGLIVTP